MRGQSGWPGREGSWSPILAGLGPGQSNRDMGGKNGHMTPKEGRRGVGGSDKGGFRKEI